MKPSEILVTNKDTIREIMKQHGLTDISVIGSCTRGEDREDSDIDFLVRLANTTVDRKSLDAYTPVFNAEEDLAAALECRVNVIDADNLYKPFLSTTAADAVSLDDYSPGCRPPRGRNFVLAKLIFRLRRIKVWARAILGTPGFRQDFRKFNELRHRNSPEDFNHEEHVAWSAAEKQSMRIWQTIPMLKGLGDRDGEDITELARQLTVCLQGVDKDLENSLALAEKLHSLAERIENKVLPEYVPCGDYCIDLREN